VTTDKKSVLTKPQRALLVAMAKWPNTWHAHLPTETPRAAQGRRRTLAALKRRGLVRWGFKRDSGESTTYGWVISADGLKLIGRTWIEGEGTWHERELIRT
jgi:hypothetical protein